MDIYIIFTIFLSFVLFQPSYGFEVIQPHNRTVNPDGSASISCEHNAKAKSVEDARLSAISLGTSRLLCQKGKLRCGNVSMYEENPNKWLFILLNIGPEEIKQTYQCEFTVKNEARLDDRKTGTPTILLPGQKEVAFVTNPPPPLPPKPHHHQHKFKPLDLILIVLLALMFLYSCVITLCYIREKRGKSEPENSTYVEMRKAPPPRNPPLDMY